MSNINKQLESWLTEISQNEGKELSLDDSGTCYLKSDSDHIQVIHAPEDGEFIYLSVFFLVSLKELSPGSLQEVLKLNLLQEKTRGGAIAIDENTDKLVLSYRDKIGDLDALLLTNLIYNIFSIATELEQKIRQYAQSSNTPVFEEVPVSGLDASTFA